LSAATPLADEGLLVPFYVNGRSVGTIWAIAHNNRRKFDAEDLRVLDSMGRFASVAYQVVDSIEGLSVENCARAKAESDLRELTDDLERQVRCRTEELEHRNHQLAAAKAQLAEEKVALERSCAQLTASRARVVATADETRRQLQRDLHDGAQQRLVHTIVTLKLAKAELADGGGHAAELVDEAVLHAERATAELGDLVRGILPAALIRGGLRTGVESLIDHLPLPVEANLDVPRLPAHVETVAYFVIAEALTNVVKHAHARKAQVSAVVTDDALLIDVQDDGRGGAHAAKGSGLVGLFDRVQAADGTLRLSSPSGQGTKISAALPLRDPRPDLR
jgi:signal transduction histidine kinase